MANASLLAGHIKRSDESQNREWFNDVFIPHHDRDQQTGEKACTNCRNWRTLNIASSPSAGFCMRFALARDDKAWPITQASDVCLRWTAEKG